MHFVFDGVGRGEGSPSTDPGVVERANDGIVDADAVHLFHNMTICCVGFGLLCVVIFGRIEEGQPFHMCGD